MQIKQAFTMKPSERLDYRLLHAQEDAELLFSLDQDPDVMRFITNGKCPDWEYFCLVMLPRLESYTNREKGWGMWGVFRRNTPQFIGWILVRPMYFFSDSCDTTNIELGWRFKQDFWGQGFATEAASHVMQTLSVTSDYEAFSAIAERQNQASIGVIKNLGMTHVRSGIHKDPLGDMDVDTYTLKI